MVLLIRLPKNCFWVGVVLLGRFFFFRSYKLSVIKCMEIILRVNSTVKSTIIPNLNDLRTPCFGHRGLLLLGTLEFFVVSSAEQCEIKTMRLNSLDQRRNLEKVFSLTILIKLTFPLVVKSDIPTQTFDGHCIMNL